MNLLSRVIVLCLFPNVLWTQSDQDTVVTFIMTGDLNFAHAFERAIQKKTFDVFGNWKKNIKYDCMVVNLENAVTRSIDSVDKEYVFKMRPELLYQLVDAGINMVNCANNHSADFGFEGILETIRHLDSAGIRHIGIGRNFSEAREPVIYEKNGIRTAWIGYGGVKDFIATRYQPGTNSRNEKYILRDIKKTRPIVDWIIVVLHWGEELETEPDINQIEMAHRIIDSGADMIIGHHPHVLQGIERYHGKVIAYSLGNFVFGGNASNVNYETAVLRGIFSKDAMNIEAIPVRVRNWQPIPATGEVATRIFKQLENRSKIFKETISYSN